MAIPIFNFVDITSGVGGAAVVATRNLGALIITSNNLVPTGKTVSFASASAVGSYFGTGSEEYARAVFYFGWISKNITAPTLLSFWNWNNDAATTSLIFGATPIDTLSQFDAITSGQLTLTMGGFTHTLTGINLSSTGSLAAVATAITTAINAYSAGGAAWTGAVVSYSSTSGTFNLVGGVTGLDVIGVTSSPSSDLAGPLGWLNPGTILSNGTAAQLLATNLANLYNLTNNFGSFMFTNALALTLSNVEIAANWNNTLNPNIQFIYTIPVTVANASTWSAGLINIGGSTLTLSPLTTEYPEMVPSMILAATNYNNVNSVQNYMYQFNFNLTPSVTNQTDYNAYIALRINFYGNTQTAGQLLNFYMRGFMMGGTNLPQYQNLYSNEIWFKDALGAALMNLLLVQSEVAADISGKSMILATLQPIINLALANGTIEVGKILTTQQQLFITQITGSATAWQQVQNAGFWVNVQIVQSVVNSVTVYTAVYTLIYSKNDVILQIIGTDVLI